MFQCDLPVDHEEESGCPQLVSFGSIDSTAGNEDASSKEEACNGGNEANVDGVHDQEAARANLSEGRESSASQQRNRDDNDDIIDIFHDETNGNQGRAVRSNQAERVAHKRWSKYTDTKTISAVGETNESRRI